MCPTWAEHRRVFQEAIGGGNLSRPALVEAMVRGGAKAWEAITFFCEAVMLAKEVASGVVSNFRLPTMPPSEIEWAPERKPVLGISATISGHFRRGVAVGKQWLSVR